MRNCAGVKYPGTSHRSAVRWLMGAPNGTDCTTRFWHTGAEEFHSSVPFTSGTREPRPDAIRFFKFKISNDIDKHPASGVMGHGDPRGQPASV
eukprot:2974459-Prymnesium_polylepis.1